jgi:pyruvate-formate lyase-activating enzyme
MANVIIFTGTSRLSQKNSKGYGPGTATSRALGAYQIASILRANGYTVQVIDYYWQLIQQPENFAQVFKKYVGPDTLWVGWSNTFFEGRAKNANNLIDPYIQQMQESIGLQERGINFVKNWCHKQNSNIKFVVGGAKTWRWSQQKFKFFDYFIEGYADATALHLTDFLAGKTRLLNTTINANGSKSVVYDKKGSLFDFSNHTHHWHKSDFIEKNASLPVEISRGCIFKCAYCNYPLNGKKKNDYIRSASKLVDELTYNYETFGTTHYTYSDDTHNDSNDKLEFLYNQVYSKLPFKIQFSTYLRLDLLCAHPYTIELLKASGLVGTFFGVESLNQDSNKTIGKSSSEEKIFENLHKVKEVWKDDVIINLGLIIGLPKDSIETCTGWLERILKKETPYDWAAIAPLQLLPNKDADPHWQNKMELNPEMYDYTFDEEGVWTNSTGMTAYDAERLKEKFDSYMLEQKGIVKHWFDPHRAVGLGVSLDQYYSLPRQELINKEDMLVQEYIKNLLT